MSHVLGLTKSSYFKLFDSVLSVPGGWKKERRNTHAKLRSLAEYYARGAQRATLLLLIAVIMHMRA